MKIRTMTPEGIIVPGKITDIWCVGTKPVVKTTTFLGRSITTTLDHLFSTPNGYMAIENLKPGMKVGLNGQELIDNASWLRDRYEQDGLTQLQIAELVGCSRTKVKSRLQKAGILIRPFHFGGWNKGIRGPSLGWFKGDWDDTQSRTWANRNFIKKECECCKSSAGLSVHHIDGNCQNNIPKNLLTLCSHCHALAHSMNAKRESVLWDKIVSIEPAGEQIVYDLSTQPYHNFVANGFIVHNCVRTAHAEENAIVYAAREGIALEDSVLYCNTKPCWNCLKLAVGAGLKAIYYKDDYDVSGDQAIQEFLDEETWTGNSFKLIRVS